MQKICKPDQVRCKWLCFYQYEFRNFYRKLFIYDIEFNLEILWGTFWLSRSLRSIYQIKLLGFRPFSARHWIRVLLGTNKIARILSSVIIYCIVFTASNILMRPKSRTRNSYLIWFVQLIELKCNLFQCENIFCVCDKWDYVFFFSVERSYCWWRTRWRSSTCEVTGPQFSRESMNGNRFADSLHPQYVIFAYRSAPFIKHDRERIAQHLSVNMWSEWISFEQSGKRKRSGRGKAFESFAWLSQRGVWIDSFIMCLICVCLPFIWFRLGIESLLFVER